MTKRKMYKLEYGTSENTYMGAFMRAEKNG
jgi:hypothetical protein